MRYSSDYKVYWDKGVSTQHSIQVEMGFKVRDFLKGRNISAVLATAQLSIRTEIQRVVIENILPKLFADIGANPTEGKVAYDSKTKVKGKSTMIEHRSSNEVDVEVHDNLSITLDTITDRPVTALEALHANKIIIADAITNDIMISLAHKYFGITNHDIHTESSVRNDQLISHDANHTGDSPSN